MSKVSPKGITQKHHQKASPKSITKKYHQKVSPQKHHPK
jgi:hypothetical protein